MANEPTCELQDFFGDPVAAVRGNSGSIMLARPASDGSDEMQVVSLNREAAEKLARWILTDTPAAPAAV